MVILIDGHNLIPHLPGLDLSDLDDEQKLIELLQVFARVRRKRIEVIFDKAPDGQPRQRTHGTIRVLFARKGLSADEEIRIRLESLGGKARHYLVVSSDQRVQTYARAARAAVETAGNFARQVMIAQSEDSHASTPGEKKLSEQEVAMWLDIFKNESRKGKP